MIKTDKKNYFSPVFSNKNFKNNFILKNGDKYFKVAERKSAVSREEPWNKWLINHGVKSTIIIPHKGTYEYWFEKNTSNKVFKNLANSIIRNWQTHIKKYPQQKQGLLNAAKILSSSVNSGNHEKILTAYKHYFTRAYNFTEYIMGAWGVILFIEPIVEKNFPYDIETLISLDRPSDYTKMLLSLHSHGIQNTIKNYR